MYNVYTHIADVFVRQLTGLTEWMGQTKGCSTPTHPLDSMCSMSGYRISKTIQFNIYLYDNSINNGFLSPSSSCLVMSLEDQHSQRSKPHSELLMQLHTFDWKQQETQVFLIEQVTPAEYHFHLPVRSFNSHLNLVTCINVNNT